MHERRHRYTGTASRRRSSLDGSVDRACFLRRYEPDQVPRVCGGATLSALEALPGGVFGCPLSLHGPYDLPPQPADDLVDDGRALRVRCGARDEGPDRSAAHVSGASAKTAPTPRPGRGRRPRRGGPASAARTRRPPGRSRGPARAARAPPNRTVLEPRRSAGHRRSSPRPTDRGTAWPRRCRWGCAASARCRPGPGQSPLPARQRSSPAPGCDRTTRSGRGPVGRADSRRMMRPPSEWP